MKTPENKSKVKVIGLLGGISHESTIDYYRKLCEIHYQKFQNYYYPEILIYSLDFQKVTDYENNGMVNEYYSYVAGTLQKMVTCGANLLAITANSPHVLYDQLAKELSVPIVSIVKTTLDQVIKDQVKSVLLLGIKYTMNSNFYHQLFEAHGITLIVPARSHQDDIEKIIFDKLSRGIINSLSRSVIVDIIKAYDVEGVILGCTELPLLMLEDELDLEIYNTTQIHVDRIHKEYLLL